MREQLVLKDGILYYRWEPPPPPPPRGTVKSRLKLVVPESLKTEMVACHDVKPSGHMGRDKTIERVRFSFIWHGLYHDIDLYIKNCATYYTQKKENVRPKAALKSYHAGRPLERVHIDMLGPFVKSKSGNVYVLMIIDQFTKWVECLAVPDQTAKTVCQILVDQFFSRFGLPLYIHSDQGRNFESNLFQEICKLLDIVKTRTTPYRTDQLRMVKLSVRTGQCYKQFVVI